MTRKAKRGADTAPYEVGYGKPPVASRFPRGTSGNPLGRPRRQRSKMTLAEAVRDLLMSDVTVVVDGRRRRMLRIEALADTLIFSALDGNTGAARLVLDLARGFVPPNDTIEVMHEGPKSLWAFTEEERKMMSYEWLTRDMVPPTDTPPADTPPTDTQPADTSPADTSPADGGDA